MKICMLAPEFLPNWGGVGTYIVELVKHLPDDFEVIVLTPDRGEVDTKPLRKNLRIIKTYKAYDTFFYNAKFQYACLKRVPELVKKESIDVIHSHTAHMPDLLLTFRKLNAPTVTTIHSTIKLQRKGTRASTASFLNTEFSEKMSYMLYPLLRLSEEFYFSGKKNYITVSNWMKNYLEQEYNLKGVRVIYNAVDTDFFRKRTDFKHIDLNEYNKPIVFYCGRLIGLKGIGVLIESMPDVLSEHKDVLFLFAGRGNQAYYEKLLRNLKIPLKNYKFLGHVDYDRLVEYYSISNVFVLPSFHENLPTSVLEAMACELPCIATNVGGVPEIVQNNVNGLLIPPGDVKQLSNKINHLLNNQEECRTMGKKARETVVKRFSWKNNIKRIVDLYESLSG